MENQLEPKTIEELKIKLLKEKGQLEQNLMKIARVVNKKEGDYQTSFDELGSDKDDNATEVDIYSENLPVELTLEKNLQDVLDTLEKIEKGTYGICENCQKLISVERLQANPSARKCISCK